MGGTSGLLKMTLFTLKSLTDKSSSLNTKINAKRTAYETETKPELKGTKIA
jgi:hypothetical protein